MGEGCGDPGGPAHAAGKGAPCLGGLGNGWRWEVPGREGSAS